MAVPPALACAFSKRAQSHDERGHRQRAGRDQALDVGERRRDRRAQEGAQLAEVRDQHVDVLEGREKIALVAADQGASSGAERSAAFRERLGAAGRTIVLPSITPDAGRKAGRRLLRMRGDVDAVICAADVLAVGLVTTLHREGVAVPEQIAVTVFDDTAILEVVDPPLTSIRHPLEAMADRAVALLNGGAEERQERVERVERFAPEIVVRMSSGAGAGQPRNRRG